MRQHIQNRTGNGAEFRETPNRKLNLVLGSPRNQTVMLVAPTAIEKSVRSVDVDVVASFPVLSHARGLLEGHGGFFCCPGTRGLRKHIRILGDGALETGRSTRKKGRVFEDMAGTSKFKDAIIWC